MLGRECVQSDEELLSLGCVLAADDLVQTIDEDTGDIVVAGMQPATKAEPACDVANRIIRCVDQTRVMRYIESQLVAAGNANEDVYKRQFCSLIGKTPFCEKSEECRVQSEETRGISALHSSISTLD